MAARKKICMDETIENRRQPNTNTQDWALWAAVLPKKKNIDKDVQYNIVHHRKYYGTGSIVLSFALQNKIEESSRLSFLFAGLWQHAMIACTDCIAWAENSPSHQMPAELNEAEIRGMVKQWKSWNVQGEIFSKTTTLPTLPCTFGNT